MPLSIGDKFNLRNRCQNSLYLTVKAVKTHEPDLFNRKLYNEYQDDFGKWQLEGNVILHKEWLKNDI
jgi:hypothetical protein